MDDDVAISHFQVNSSKVQKTHAHASVLHGTCNACVPVGFVFVLDGLKRLHQASCVVNDLAVWKCLTWPYGVAVANLPVRDSNFVCNVVEHGLYGKARLGYTKASECARRRVVGVVGVSVYLEVLVVVWARCMCARPLQNRKPQRCVCARVCNHSGFETLDYAVFIASKGEVHIHWVSLWMHQNAFLPRELHLAWTFGE